MICIRCGCTDDRACIGGCSWTRVSHASVDCHGRTWPPGAVGICSACDDGVPDPRFVRLGDFDEFNQDELLPDDDMTEYDFEGPSLILPGDPEFHL